MKKKAKEDTSSKVLLGRRKSTTPPGKIGGLNESIKLDWGKVGRKKLNDDTSLVEMGAELKAIRQQQGVSLGSLAKRMDVAPATIIKFEDRGYPVSIKVVNGMAAQLGYKLQLVEVQSSPKAAVKKAAAKKKKKKS